MLRAFRHIAVVGATLLLAAPAVHADPGGLCFVPPSERVTVGGGSELAKAVLGAKCGSVLSLAAGSYTEDITLDQECSADKPLVLAASERQGADLSGRLKLTGSNLVVTGLRIDGGGIELAGQANRATRNLFLSGGGLVIRGADGRIDHNEFRPAAGNGIDVALKLSKNDRRPARGNLIDYNLFHSMSAGQSADDEADDDDGRRPSVALYLGEFSARKGRADMLAYGMIGTVVEQNLFLDVARRRSIHVKSNGNQIRNNTFVEARGAKNVGQVTIRSGQNNEIAGNYVAGNIRILLFEEDNRAIGNVLVDGAQLIVMAGGGEMTQYDGPQQRPAVRSFLAGNQGILRIGQAVERRRNKAPAEGTVVEGHQGPIDRELETGTTISATTSVPLPKVERLAPDAVGLLAADPHCPNG